MWNDKLLEVEEKYDLAREDQKVDTEWRSGFFVGRLLVATLWIVTAIL